MIRIGNIMQGVGTLYSATMDGLQMKKINERIKALSWDCFNTNCKYYQFSNSYFILRKRFRNCVK